MTRIPTWKFELCRTHIRAIVGAAGEMGFAFADLPAAVAARLSANEAARFGSVGWHTTSVKLEMEVAGELERLPKTVPQRLRLVR